jgi:hypothetical protein
MNDSFEAKHTPGPWHTAEILDEGKLTIEVRAPNENPLAVVLQCGTASCLSNARLLAAAPDLLKALQELEPFFDSLICYASTMAEYEPNRIVGDARAAIAKATGDENGKN